MRTRLWASGFWLSALLASGGCATATQSAAVTPPVVTWEQKLQWMIRLEDQRILRDPNPPPPAILAPATRNRPAVVAPPPPSDLIRLLGDSEARVRRRAAQALGRVGLPDAVEPLAALLMDPEQEVRQMAAFALGLIGHASARPALTAALADADPIVQGRAAEALGNIGDRSDAAAVAAMTQAHVAAIRDIPPDDLTYPMPPPVEAVRLGLYALVRLNAYDAIAATVLDPSGGPVSRWWPVAYALQRPGDARATPALLELLNTPGRYTAAFAARGLGTVKAQQAAAALRRIVEQRQADPAVVIQAVRALSAIGDAAAAPVLEKIALDTTVDVTLRGEALTAFSALASADSLDLMLDLVSDSSPIVRAAAMRTMARLDAEGFMSVLSGLDPDRDWTVRAAIATALGTIPTELGLPRLRLLLQDREQRLVPAVIRALVASKAPDAERLLVDLLTADDFVVRASAATALGELKAQSAVAPLIAAYRGSEGDSTYVARAAALAAAARISPEAARPVLQDALNDREWAIRVRAAALLREQGVTAADPVRPAPQRAIDQAAWDMLLNPKFSPHAYIETDRGTIELELAILDAPLTVANFIALARKGFFNGIAVHRVVPDFVVQDGDPRGDGEGGPGYAIRDEINQRPYLRGTVGMALDWEDTGGSQFFITHSPQPHLDTRYTVFGHVVNGMTVVDQMQQWDVIRRVTIWDGITPQ